MGYEQEQEGLGVEKCSMTDFTADLIDRLTLLAMDDPQKWENDFGLTEADILKPMLIIGPPGVGKTAGIVAAIKMINEKYKDKGIHFDMKKIQLGQTIVGDFTPMPVVNNVTGKVERLPMPELPQEERDGRFGVLFLDEITSADTQQVQPALGLCDDTRTINVDYTLPNRWLVVGAGNGPDCGNFVKLDDMTLSRFITYDLDYRFETDWRDYAHQNGIDENILAFLNFAPEYMVKVQSTDFEKAGKLFPCPRTWSALSGNMKLREASGRKIKPSEMLQVASRAIGSEAATKFQAFYKLAMSDEIKYDAKNILAGTERDPDPGLKREIFHILLERMFTILKEIKKTGTCDIKDGNGKLLTIKECFGNAMTWIVKVNEIDTVIKAIIEAKDSVPDLAVLIAQPTFKSEYPEIAKFFQQNSATIARNLTLLKKSSF